MRPKLRVVYILVVKSKLRVAYILAVKSKLRGAYILVVKSKLRVAYNKKLRVGYIEFCYQKDVFSTSTLNFQLANNLFRFLTFGFRRTKTSVWSGLSKLESVVEQLVGEMDRMQKQHVHQFLLPLFTLTNPLHERIYILIPFGWYFMRVEGLEVSYFSSDKDKKKS